MSQRPIGGEGAKDKDVRVLFKIVRQDTANYSRIEGQIVGQEKLEVRLNQFVSIPQT
jgi:hypothetical protein